MHAVVLGLITALSLTQTSADVADPTVCGAGHRRPRLRPWRGLEQCRPSITLAPCGRRYRGVRWGVGQPSSRRHHATYPSTPPPPAGRGPCRNPFPGVFPPGGLRPGMNAVPADIQSGCPGKFDLAGPPLGAKRRLPLAAYPRRRLLRGCFAYPIAARVATTRWAGDQDRRPYSYFGPDVRGDG